MNNEPLSTLMKDGGVEERVAASSEEQKKTIPSSMSSHAAVKIRNSLAVIQTLMDPYLSVANETELCCVAVRLDELDGMMQSRVGGGMRVMLESSSRGLEHVDNVGDRPSLSPFSSINGDVTNLLQSPPARPKLSRAASMSSIQHFRKDRHAGSTQPHMNARAFLSPSPSVTFSDQVSVSYLLDGNEEYSMYNQAQSLIDSNEGGSPTLRNQVLPVLSKFANIVSLPVDKSWKETATQIFNQVDKDKDGFLDRNEVKEALLQLGEVDERFKFIKEPTTYAGSLVDAGDQNGDNKIDKSEFMKMVRPGALNKKDDKKKTPRAKALERSSRFASSLFLAPRDKSIETLTIGNDKWLLHPKSSGHLVWGLMISILVFVIMITMPLSFGWREFGDRLVVCNTIVDFVFMLDVVKTFFTGSVDDDDNIIMDSAKIRRKYLREAFVVDVISSLPLDLMFFLTKHMETGTTKNTIKLLKLLLIAKLLRFRRLKNAFNLFGTISAHLEESFNIRISDGFAKIIRLFFMATILAHWIGCFNFMLVQSFDFPLDSWAVYAGLEHEPPAVQWSWSLFKALAQMIMIGFETPPFTNGSCDTFTRWCQIEHWVTLACLYFGAVFYSFLITYMLAIIQTTFYACRNFEEKFMELDGWMRVKKMPTELRNQVKNNFRRSHANGKLYDDAVLRLIAPSDLVNIHRFQAEQLLSRIPFFVELRESGGLIKELAFHMDRVVMSKNDVIFDESTHGDSVCFIESGLVELYLPSSDNPTYRVIGERCFFGEVSPLFGTVRTAAARVKRDCVLFQIASDDFLTVLKDFPLATRALKKVALERLTRVQAYRNPDPEDTESAKDDDIDTQDARVANSDKGGKGNVENLVGNGDSKGQSTPP